MGGVQDIGGGEVRPAVSKEEIAQIRDLAARFVRQEMMPLEPDYLRRAAFGIEPALLPEHEEHLRQVSKDLGLWGLDAPVELGGMDLPVAAMAGVVEEMAKTVIPFRLPPDSPNLRMMLAVGTDEQKAKYLPGYIAGTLTSAIGLSEPGAGGDPAAIQTRAVRDDDSWVLNGRKIWFSSAAKADFSIIMARVGDGKRHEGITAFIVEKGVPGFIIERAIPMLGGVTTYEVVFDDCRLPHGALLGEVGQGYAPMQLRLRARRMEMASTAAGITQRALDMMIDHARERVTFGVRLADRQAIQWWIADIATRLHALRLMIADMAEKVDNGDEARFESSMIKTFSTELAYEAADHAMQTLGALGMTKETALYPLWQAARLMRIYEGPSEVHRQAVAKHMIGRA